MKKLIAILIIITTSITIFSQIYIDPTNSNDPIQNGSIDHPYDRWSDFTIQSNTTYLMKRGTLYSSGSSIVIISKINVTISTYGSGDKPTIIYTGGNSNIRADGCTNLLIEGIKFVGGEAGVLSCGAHGGRSANNQTIKNCEVYGGWRGINSEVWESETGIITGLLIENCIIHGQGTDGIFAKSNTNATYNNITIIGCHIYDVNQKWLQYQDGSCDGDCIHLLRADNVLIENNILDRRGTSYKFALIVIGRTDTEKAVIKYNTIYPPNQHQTWSSNAIYFQILDQVDFVGNKIIGSEMPAGQSSTACGILRCKKANIFYNLFDNIGVIVAAGAPTPFIHNYYNNTIKFYLQGNENYFISSGNQPIYLTNNIFLMPTGTSLVNDGMNGQINVHRNSNIELYSNDISYFNTMIHFKDISRNDYHLTRQSVVAVDKGVDYITLEMLYDIDKEKSLQGSGRDIGCDELKRNTWR